MSNRVSLSSAFNASTGYVPALISIILCSFMSQGFAIYIGLALGIAYSLFLFFRNKKHVYNFILYSTNVVMLLLAITNLLGYWNDWGKWFPFFLQMAVTIPLFITYLNQDRILVSLIKKEKRKSVQAAESAFIAIRILLVFTLIHFAIIMITLMFTRSLETTMMWVLSFIVPGIVFLGCIVFNQIGLNQFNKSMSRVKYVPTINEKGIITGKIIENEIAQKGNTILIPVIRIAIEYNGMLFLTEPFESDVLGEAGKIDTPLESVLYYKESLEEALKRMLQTTFPTARKLKPRFNLKYHYKDEKSDKVVYLFMLSVKDDMILCDPRFVNGKLWTLQQIEQNLGTDYFSMNLEYEYDHLSTVIYTIKKYKGS